MFAYLNKLKDRAEKFLNEKNIVTDCLAKVEEWTGIKKRYLAVGKFSFSDAGFFHIMQRLIGRIS